MSDRGELKITYFEIYNFAKKLLTLPEVILIFEKAFGISRKELILCKHETAENSSINIFLNLLFERKSGRPLAYVLGETEFMGIKMITREGVLIPRGDTEALVRETLTMLKTRSVPCEKILDLCSGSGAVAIAIEKNLARLDIQKKPEIIGIEVSSDAVKIFRENVLLNKSKVKIMQADVFKIHEKFAENSVDAIVSNPPYIESHVIKALSEDVQKEPHLALDGGPTGLRFYEMFAQKWFSKIKNGGFIAVEIGYNQCEEVTKIFSKCTKDIHVKRDINGIKRVVIAFKS